MLKGVLSQASFTEGNASETQPRRQSLKAGRLYVIDRGYAQYPLFQQIIDADSSFIGRLRNNTDWTLIEQRPLSAEAKAAGVRRH